MASLHFVFCNALYVFILFHIINRNYSQSCALARKRYSCFCFGSPISSKPKYRYHCILVHGQTILRYFSVISLEKRGFGPLFPILRRRTTVWRKPWFTAILFSPKQHKYVKL